MRCSHLAWLILLAVGVAVGVAGCDALSPPVCVRHSDCPTSQVCGATGQCMVPPDAGPDDAIGDGGGSTTADAAPVDAAAAQAKQP